MEDQSKNLILATALSFIVILAWFVFFPPQEQISEPVGISGEGSDVLVPDAGTLQAFPDTAGAETQAEARRIGIETPNLTGSISLLGGRIDDLSLSKYLETLDDDSEIVRLLSHSR